MGIIYVQFYIMAKILVHYIVAQTAYLLKKKNNLQKLECAYMYVRFYFMAKIVVHYIHSR